MTADERIADALESIAVSFVRIVDLIEEAKKKEEGK